MPNPEDSTECQTHNVDSNRFAVPHSGLSTNSERARFRIMHALSVTVLK